VIAILLVFFAMPARSATPPKSATPVKSATPKELPDALTVMQRSEKVLEDLAERVRPAVVNVRRFEKDEAWWSTTRGTSQADSGWRVVPDADRLYPHYAPCRGASGFLISADGYLITLRRLVIDSRTGEPAEVVDIELGAEHYRAQVVSVEPTLDIAILKIKSDEPLPFLRFGDSTKSRAGHWAIAFGDPDGHVRTLLPGFVAVPPSRECYQDDLSATYIQISTLIPDGALGGPLVNLDGEVIGVNARLGASTSTDPSAPAAGSGFALPSNITSGIYQAMLMKESMESPWLGISVLFMDDTLKKKLGGGRIEGISIDNVFDPSPAAAAGIKVGDVLRSIDDEVIGNVYDFQRMLYYHGAGSRVRLGLVRDRKKYEVTVTIERRPPGAETR
jgi:serine protease Do